MHTMSFVQSYTEKMQNASRQLLEARVSLALLKPTSIGGNEVELTVDDAPSMYEMVFMEAELLDNSEDQEGDNPTLTWKLSNDMLVKFDLSSLKSMTESKSYM